MFLIFLVKNEKKTNMLIIFYSNILFKKYDEEKYIQR